MNVATLTDSTSHAYRVNFTAWAKSAAVQQSNMTHNVQNKRFIIPASYFCSTCTLTVSFLGDLRLVPPPRKLCFTRDVCLSVGNFTWNYYHENFTSDVSADKMNWLNFWRHLHLDPCRHFSKHFSTVQDGAFSPQWIWLIFLEKLIGSTGKFCHGFNFRQESRSPLNFGRHLDGIWSGFALAEVYALRMLFC